MMPAAIATRKNAKIKIRKRCLAAFISRLLL
jgi:hypothetical protein